jgi:D-alanyl-D-alanine carboxypeptidase
VTYLGCQSDNAQGSHTTQTTVQAEATLQGEITSPGGSRFSEENVQRLDGAIAKEMEDKNLPGVMVGVWVPGQGQYVTAKGKANLDIGRELQPEDPFRIGSVTKTFVATAILQLVDEGKLSKSDPLSKWYPHFPKAEKITIDDLLRMRSGIADYWDERTLKQYYEHPLEDVSTQDTIKAAAAKADEFEPPNKKTKYTDVNYAILGEIVEKVSGKDLHEQIASEILKPLGMNNTLYPVHDYLPGDLRGYGWDPKSKKFEDKTILNPAPPGGAGAMISTLPDLHKWAKANYTGGGLLKLETQKARLETQHLEGAPASARYGEGIAKLGKFWGHNGVIQGFSTDMYYLPDKDAVIVIGVNRADEDYESRSDDVLSVLAKILFPEYVKRGSQGRMAISSAGIAGAEQGRGQGCSSLGPTSYPYHLSA